MDEHRDPARGEPMPELALSAPAPVAVVAPDEAERQLAVEPADVRRVEGVVAAFMGRLAEAEVDGDGFGRLASDVARIGEREILASARMSAVLLERPVRAMGGVLEGEAPVARRLAELRRLVEAVDPARDGAPGAEPRRARGILPVGDPIDDALDRSRKDRQRIETIVAALGGQRAELIRDNAAVEQEERLLWAEMQALRRYALLAERLDATLAAHVGNLEAADPRRAAILRTDLLFSVRQRRQAILTQLAIATQGFAALRIVEHNNEQVIRAIQAATTTTVAAVRTSILAARAVAARRLVAEQLQAAESARREASGATKRRRGSTAAPTTPVGVAAAAAATSAKAAAQVAAVQRAWGAVYATLDQIDRYKLEALAAMRATVRELGGQVDRSRAYIEQADGLSGDPDRARPDPGEGEVDGGEIGEPGGAESGGGGSGLRLR